MQRWYLFFFPNMKQLAGENNDLLVGFKHSTLQFIIKISCLVTEHCCRGYSFRSVANMNVFLGCHSRKCPLVLSYSIKQRHSQLMSLALNVALCDKGTANRMALHIQTSSKQGTISRTTSLVLAFCRPTPPYTHTKLELSWFKSLNTILYKKIRYQTSGYCARGVKEIVAVPSMT